MFKSLGNIFRVFAGGASASNREFHASAKCPECGSQLARDTTIPDAGWRCPNPDCLPEVRRRIAHWCAPVAMDIVGADATMVETLVNSGLVRDVAEIYKLKVKELAALPGLNQDSAQKFFDAITASTKRDAWQVVFGLAIPHLGAEVARTLCKSFRSVDDLFAAGRERIQKQSGVSEAVARSLADWYMDPVNRRLVSRLAKAGVNFKSAIYEPSGGPTPSSSR